MAIAALSHFGSSTNASRRFAVWGVSPLGNLIGGALLTALGLTAAIWIGALGASLSAIPLLLSPMRHVHDTDKALEMVRAINEAFAPTPAGA